MALTWARRHRLEDRRDVDDLPPGRIDDTGWIDLATNRPGQAVARLAAAYRRARPVSSRLEPLLGLHSEAQAWAKGAAGERATAKALRPLTQPVRGIRGLRQPRWRVLHSVPLGDYGTDIDHLLIGPSGVFGVNTRRHQGKTVWVGPKTVKVDRQVVDYSTKARTDAYRAQQLLAAAGADVDVWPIIAVVGGIVTGRPATKDGVLVVNVNNLVHQLTTWPEILADDRVNEIFALARRSDTWTTMIPRTA